MHPETLIQKHLPGTLFRQVGNTYHIVPVDEGGHASTVPLCNARIAHYTHSSEIASAPNPEHAPKAKVCSACLKVARMDRNFHSGKKE